jgi:hypothetical protein
MKETCKCGHSKKSHVMDFDNTRCCAFWQNEKGTRMCECMAYEEIIKGVQK